MHACLLKVLINYLPKYKINIDFNMTEIISKISSPCELQAIRMGTTKTVAISDKMKTTLNGLNSSVCKYN